jgi:hypothetical protein
MKWIKHDTDANQDAKLQNVLLDYGLEGYGLYWYCIELIAGKVDKENITFELEHDARIIARNVGSTPQKVEEMMKYFVKLGLFENCQGTITCLKLAKRLDKSMTSNPEMRNIIENLKSHDSIMTESEIVMQDKIRLDKNRLDNKKQKRTVFAKPSIDEVISYFGEYAISKQSFVSRDEPEKYFDFYESKNWMVGKNKMKCWKSAARNWMRDKLTKKTKQPKDFKV